MVGSMRNAVAFGALSALVFGAGCGSSSGDDDTSAAGTSGMTGGAGAGAAGGAALGGSAGEGGTGGSAGLATTGGTGGASGSSGSSDGGCTQLVLPQGVTGPNGLVQVYASDDSTGGDVASGFVEPVGTDGDYAYFSEGYTASSTLERLSFTTGTVEKLGTMNGANATVKNGVLYYSVMNTTTSKVQIWSAPVADLTTTTLLVDELGTLQQNLLADDDSVYWSETASGGVWSVPVAGGTPQDLARDAQPNGMVLQGDDVYWLDFNTEYLERVPKTGGAPEPLAPIFFGGRMASDATAVYWLDSSENTLNRWTPGASSPTTLDSFDFFDEPEGLVADGGTVYYALGFGCGVVWKVGAGGGDPTRVAQGFPSVGLIGVDATHLYVTATDSVYRVDR